MQLLRQDLAGQLLATVRNSEKPNDERLGFRERGTLAL